MPAIFWRRSWPISGRSSSVGPEPRLEREDLPTLWSIRGRRFRDLRADFLSITSTHCGARAALDVLSGACVLAKHLPDHLRSARHVEPCRIRETWADHREDHHPLAGKDRSWRCLDIAGPRPGLPARATQRTHVERSGRLITPDLSPVPRGLPPGRSPGSTAPMGPP